MQASFLMTSIKNDFLFRCKSETSEVVLVTAESQILELNINSLLSSRVFILQILPWWPTHHFSLSLGSHRSGRGSWNLQVVDCRHQLLFLPLSQELSAQAKYPMMQINQTQCMTLWCLSVDIHQCKSDRAFLPRLIGLCPCLDQLVVLFCEESRFVWKSFKQNFKKKLSEYLRKPDWKFFQTKRKQGLILNSLLLEIKMLTRTTFNLTRPIYHESYVRYCDGGRWCGCW